MTTPLQAGSTRGCTRSLTLASEAAGPAVHPTSAACSGAHAAPEGGTDGEGRGAGMTPACVGSEALGGLRGGSIEVEIQRHDDATIAQTMLTNDS